MKSIKNNKIATIALATVTVAAMATNALACTRYIANTDHGPTTIRSLDWGERLGAVAAIHPVGEVRLSEGAGHYAKPAAWIVKHHTVAMEEPVLFHGTVTEALNDKGFAAMALYMNDSKPFVKEHKDNGAPAVNQADIITFFAENYESVAEVLHAHENGEFQIAWGDQVRGTGADHGIHFAVTDKSGAIALFQLNEGGEEVIHKGTTADDLSVMTNSPLQQGQRDYAAKYDIDANEFGSDLPGSISSPDRNVRMLFNASKQDYTGLDLIRTAALQQQAFDASVLIPHGVADPMVNGSGATYATWVTFQYNLESGDFKVRDIETATSVTFNINDTKGLGEERYCADAIEQARAGAQTLKFAPCP
ncbi:linear amide C-N hydrolase [Rhodobacteraceae bacterium RKSG542]|uniref:linear amide C-N hydrolase n=1 Tax=Pseudovibrio flavus TaxID=2529854 RepID=UPI0012BD1F26|nr:linear amide C-N hydrolase [Pseudovibrio flavus]MTI17951.1 linear amide C-N hydrolase [Pseudovibrio flavus]